MDNEYVCENCGADCRNLVGFSLFINRNSAFRVPMVQVELRKIEEKYGKSKFFWCWPCTIEAFGRFTKKVVGKTEAQYVDKTPKESPEKTSPDQTRTKSGPKITTKQEII